MNIEKNTTYACRVVSINGEEVDYLSELVVDEECITRITIKEVERKIYDKVGSETFVNVVVKYEAIYITVVECQLVKRSYRMGSDCNENKINLEYMSSLMLLDYLWTPSQEIRVSGINCEITETTELLGVYPYQIDYDELTYISKNISMLGLYLSYLELNGIEYEIDCRPNNKFCINKCFVHRSLGKDYPFTIIENDGLFACRGCHQGGHIIDFIGEAYNIETDKILKILFSYINGTYDKLSEEDKKFPFKRIVAPL